MKHTQGEWIYSPHFKDGAQGHIYLGDKAGAVCINLIGAAAMGQKELNECATLMAAAPQLFKAGQKSVKHIIQLCNMVNGYSNKLGLGQKVNVEDFIEPLQDAITKAKQP
ncbi:MAG: hypothetical protein ABJH04_08000 [Cyclobacteriaceae bacterium]